MTHSTTEVKTTLREEKLTEAMKYPEPRTIYGQVATKTKVISFDEKHSTILSKDILSEFIKQARVENVFSENGFVSPECYVLVDRNGKDFYPFPVEEIDEWEKDGSFERGDTLYKMNRLKTF